MKTAFLRTAATAIDLAKIGPLDLALALTCLVVLNALAMLPAEQREVFLLHEEGGLTLDEIATVTGAGRETAPATCPP